MAKLKLDLPEGLGPQTPSEHKQAMRDALQWLQEHPLEKPYMAARRFGLKENTVRIAVRRARVMATGQEKNLKQHGGGNRILSPAQEKVITRFIQDQLNMSLLPTKGTVFSAICHIRKADGLDPPSLDWFGRWWPKMGLHKIRTKPLARDRVTAQDPNELHNWFVGYREILGRYNIRRDRIDNFDETGFRVGCPKGVEVIVPDEVKEVRLRLKFEPEIQRY
jgi:hypothetical protein